MALGAAAALIALSGCSGGDDDPDLPADLAVTGSVGISSRPDGLPLSYSPVPSGSTLRYAFRLTNEGPGRAREVSLQSTVDSRLVLDTFSCAASGGAVCPASLGATTVVQDLPAGASLDLVLNLRTPAGMNEAAVVSLRARSIGDANAVNDQATLSSSVYAADVNVVIEREAGTAGAPPVVRVTIRNPTGPSAAYLATTTMALDLPSGFGASAAECVEVSASSCFSPGPPGPPLRAPFFVSPGGQLALRYTLSVPSGWTGPVTATARGTIGGDPTPTDQVASVTFVP
jgi:hypothetical protein